jgi:hypothetical protein
MHVHRKFLMTVPIADFRIMSGLDRGTSLVGALARIRPEVEKARKP